MEFKVGDIAGPTSGNIRFTIDRIEHIYTQRECSGSRQLIHFRGDSDHTWYTNDAIYPAEPQWVKELTDTTKEYKVENGQVYSRKRVN